MYFIQYLVIHFLVLFSVHVEKYLIYTRTISGIQYVKRGDRKPIEVNMLC
jgi:hypothetical protein